MFSYAIRPARTTDIPAITRIYIETSSHEPIAKIPWARPEDFLAAVQGNYEWIFRRPDYHSLVAYTPVGEDDEKILGFLIWRRPKKEGEELEEWKPNLADGTNMKFFGGYLSAIEDGKKGYDTEHLFEVESLSVSPDQERRGIASSMMKIFLEGVDKDGASSFLRSTVMARRLYEKFGWKVVREMSIDLKEYGWEQPRISYAMFRDGVPKAEASS